MLALLAIPFALTYAFGRLVGDQRQGWAVFAAMFVLWIASAGIAMGFEIDGNPRVEALGTTDAGNYEGKEVRFGPAAPASSPRPRRARRPARSTRHTTASRRSAAPCRS